MPIQRFVVGPMGNNCYILYSELSTDAAIVDPGMGSEVLNQWISEKELQVKYVLNTHGHADHVFNNSFFSFYNAPLVIGKHNSRHRKISYLIITLL